MAHAECGPELPVADARLDQLVSATARQRGAAIAVRCADKRLSYAQLDARASALAVILARSGVRPRSLVGVFMARSVDLVVSLLAVHKCGAAYVPLDPMYPAERIQMMLEDSEAPAVVTTSDLARALPARTNARAVCVDELQAEREVHHHAQ